MPPGHALAPGAKQRRRHSDPRRNPLAPLAKNEALRMGAPLNLRTSGRQRAAARQPSAEAGLARPAFMDEV